MLKFLKRFGICLLSIIVILGIIVVIYLQHPMFGANPSGDRLARIQQSPNYHDGQFWNLSDTPMMTPDENGENNTSILSWFKTDDGKRVPDVEIPNIKTDLKSLPKDENVLVWLGHSAYFMILDGKEYLVDPTLVKGSPVWFVNVPFPGSNVYSPEDIPDIDYLIITHDHYDHLDYFTMKEIKDKVGKVITSLGVGAHLEKWGFAPENIIELDWYEDSDLDDVKISCLPARHYAGRLFNQNNTLRSSFMIESPTKTIYVGGDSGYDFFFKEIGEKWQNIDLAIIENGQYDIQWRYIHMLPDDVVKAIKDLNAKKVFTDHNSKYSMANHDWDAPMIELDKRLQEEGIDSWITPIIGQVVDLEFNKNHTFVKWWLGEEYNSGNDSIEKEIIEENLLFTENEEMNTNNIINLKVGDKTFDLVLEENSATEALKDKLKKGDILINAHEYGGFEKVGDLGFDLPREDKQITTEAGDLVLYNGNQISLFYDSNSWSYTKLGKVQNISQSELKEILGDGDVTLVFSLKK